MDTLVVGSFIVDKDQIQDASQALYTAEEVAAEFGLD